MQKKLIATLQYVSRAWTTTLRTFYLSLFPNLIWEQEFQQKFNKELEKEKKKNVRAQSLNLTTTTKEGRIFRKNS